MAEREPVEIVEIVKLGFAEVLAALYNNAGIRQRRFGRQYSSAPMTLEEARQLISRKLWFGAINGRRLNFAFNDDDELNVGRYNQANGPGLGQRVIENLRRTGSISKILD